jgi:hypothetical protein
MTSDPRSVHDDLAFLRSLVDEDWRPGVWTFGAVYVTIGAALVVHVLISWSAGAGYVPLQGGSLLAVYFVLYTVASLVWTALARRFRGDRTRIGALGVSVKGRAGAVALGSAFLGHLVMLCVFVIVALRQRNGVFLELAPLVLFTLQGVAWFVVHAMRRQRWQAVVAWGWLLATLALAPLVGTSAFGLAVAAVAMALMVIPGVHMMRMARAD